MAINDVTSIDVKTLPPFKRLIMTIGELPTSYLESMSYAELLMWFCNFLQNKVLPTINNNADALQDVITYLEDLDLQDEVNNKLDEMAESGQLQEIVAEYLNANALWCFDNVANMKSAPNLINGSYAKTLGFHAKNDGGMATYKIRNITNSDTVDEITIISLNNSDELIAELICDDEINVLKLGADPTNTNNNDFLIPILKNKFYKKVWYFPEGVYKFNSTITLDNYFYIKLENNTTLKYDGNNTSVFITTTAEDNDCRHSYIKGGIIDGNNKVNNLINLLGMKQFLLQEILLQGFKQKCVYLAYYNNYKTQGMIDRVYIANTGQYSNTYGIYEQSGDDTSDNKYSFITSRDVSTLFYTTDARVIECHPWILTPSLIPNSKIAYINGDGGASFVNCYKDTLQYGFETSKYGRLSVTGMFLYDNSQFYTEEYFTNYPQTLFKVGQYSVINISDIQGNCTHSMTICDFQGYTPSNYNRFSNISINTYSTGNPVTLTNLPIYWEDEIKTEDISVPITIPSDAQLFVSDASATIPNNNHYKLIGISPTLMTGATSPKNYIVNTRIVDPPTKNFNIYITNVKASGNTGTFNFGFKAILQLKDKYVNKTYTQ